MSYFQHLNVWGIFILPLSVDVTEFKFICHKYFSEDDNATVTEWKIGGWPSQFSRFMHLHTLTLYSHFIHTHFKGHNIVRHHWIHVLVFCSPLKCHGASSALKIRERTRTLECVDPQVLQLSLVEWEYNLFIVWKYTEYLICYM